MELEHEFTLDKPVDEVWPVLIDLREVAAALPGASVEDVESDGTHRGALRVALGSFVAQFRGTARYTEIDADAHRVTMEGRGSSPQGQAVVRLVGQATSAGDGQTSVSLRSSVELTGRIGQFGGAMAADVAEQVLDRFVDNLSARFDGAQHDGPTTTARAPTASTDVEPLQLGSVLGPAILNRPVPLIAAVAVGVLAWLLGRRSRGGGGGCTIVINTADPTAPERLGPDKG